MEPKEHRKLEMRGVAAVAAVVIALMGFSAALANRSKPEPEPAAARSSASSYSDPSLAGLRVADDAEVDTTVELYN